MHTLHVLHLLDLHQVHLHNCFQIWLLCFGKREKKEWQKNQREKKKSGKKSREKKKVLCKIQKFQLGRKISEACVLCFSILVQRCRRSIHIFFLVCINLISAQAPFCLPHRAPPKTEASSLIPVFQSL